MDEGAAHQEAAAAAFARADWAEVHRLLAGNDPDALGLDGLDQLAIASYLTGHDDDAVAAWDAAHHLHLAQADPAAAALRAFWAAFCSMMRGQMAHAGGWLSRADTIMGDDLDCPARGYVMIPALLQALDAGEPQRSQELALEALDTARRFHDRDLAAFATLALGQVLLALGEQEEGLARLDEVMLSVCAGEVGQIVSGIVYCAVILECMQLYDLARASEWTAALAEWCDAQPDMVPFRGQCLVHQSQLQQVAGEWDQAAETVSAARERLTTPPHPALGLACYQEGELRRLRGRFDDAAEAYAQASRAGYEPMPGMALLEMARGDTTAAIAGIQRAVAEASQPFQRPGLLAASVEICLAAGEPGRAREAADELVEIAATSRSEMLGAVAQQCRGAALLGAGEVNDAMRHLRVASGVWQRLKMPYETARTAELIGQCCTDLGDTTSATLEFDRARELFGSLGAQYDLLRLRSRSGGPSGAGELSPREVEVLSLVAEGKTSREIAELLVISQHTVRRHIENIFAKLGVNSRAAATALAYERHLL